MPDLFAGIAVSDLAAAVGWYSRLFGAPPAFYPNDTEAVWDLGDHRYVFIEHRPGDAGHARHLLFVDDLEALLAKIAERGLRAVDHETYANGVTKAAFEDPDGNRFEFGGR